MPRPRAGVKYGAADNTDIFTCPDGHIHLVGKDSIGQKEYEIVLGKEHFKHMAEALDAVGYQWVLPNTARQ